VQFLYLHVEKEIKKRWSCKQGKNGGLGGGQQQWSLVKLN
jgi:hypothetical protein